MSDSDLSVLDEGAGRPHVPFDSAYLDELMEDAELDALLVTSKHNIQYLLGGYRAQFFGHMDAMGVSRFLPTLIYPKGAPEKAAYIGHPTEKHKMKAAPVWVQEVQMVAAGSTDAMEHAVAYMRKAGLRARRIGIERSFLPVDAADVLKAALPDARFVEALPVLERLRAVKRADELIKLRDASELVTDAMLAVIAGHGPGTTKKELVEALKREEVNRGLDFDYCLITTGSSLNRASSDERWEMGSPLSLDSGGTYEGYIADLTRMAVLGEPDSELQDLLEKVDEVQHAAFRAIVPGRPAGEVFAMAQAALERLPERNFMHFVAHGMGVITHEVPHLPTGGIWGYPPSDNDRPLEPGLVLSVETTLGHPKRGFIKLEDTVAVTQHDHELFGERARGWNRGGTALP